MTTKTNKTTANLRVLSDANPYNDPDERENYSQFRHQLADWCCQWTWDVAVPVMQSCEKLYENQAVRILVIKWFIANESYKSHRNYEMLHVDDDFEIPDVDLYADDRSAYNQALYALLVQR